MERRQPTVLSLLLLASLACGAGPDPGEPTGTPAAAEPAREEAPDATGLSEPPPGPPGAQWEVVEILRSSRELAFHPSDGGGRVRLAAVDPPDLVASSAARFTLVFETGPEGIAEGGAIYLQISPFWEWSTPQAERPELPGYTLVETEAEGVTLEPRTIDTELMIIEVGGRALAPGEEVTIVYGAGPARARVDRFADREARLWIAVDGDGDGLRRLILDSPHVSVRAGPPARLQVGVPGVVRPGERARMCVAVLDAVGNAGVRFEGEIELADEAGVLDLPERITLQPEQEGVVVLEVPVVGAGTTRVAAVGPGDLAAVSNPLRVAAEGPRVLWADLHGHTGLSDGTGTPEDYLRYARDVACLDAVSLTDHDHWGIVPLADQPEMWERIRRETRRFHDPPRFVTLLGYEWTNWIYGHRHVLWFGDEGRVYDSVDPRYETPTDLWAALEGQPALTVAHHSAGGPVPTDWSFPPDPRFEPVTEIVSVHGSSEAPDAPIPIYNPVPGNFVRDVLDRGIRLGFVGSGDSHDGHPGLPQIDSSSGGLAAILVEERSREGILAALRARRSYATNGARILVRAALGLSRMGETLRVPEGGSVDEDLFVGIVAEAPLARLDVIRSGELIGFMPLEGLLEADVKRELKELRAGEYVYVRIVQENGGAAWTSPIFVE